MQPVWAPRLGACTDDRFSAFSASVDDDLPYLHDDLAGSIAHVSGLHRAGLLDTPAATALIEGLQGLPTGLADGSFAPDAALEDLHMNIEAHLTQVLGAPGRRLHTGRSRNDQVATCLVLAARRHLAAMAQGLHDLGGALLAQAGGHTTTAWIARTHGRPAQPGTVAFLLHAHALRCQALEARCLAAFDAIGVSPLGGGAVAGSTLPLDLDHTAGLLGLRPPQNALLATGARDAVEAACETAAHAGVLVARLAIDLLQLHTDGGLVLADGHATGSSLMPHKKNPDALELLRGHGHALQGPAAAVHAVTSGLGLGYQRDLQVVKPWLTKAAADATALLDLAAHVVQSARFQAVPLDDPGLAATDVAEALVRQGLPFREAYGLVAAAFAAAERGGTVAAGSANTVADALACGLRAAGHEGSIDAAMAALQADPARRTTTGAPATMPDALRAASEAQGGLADALHAAQAAVQVPAALLEASPADLLEAA